MILTWNSYLSNPYTIFRSYTFDNYISGFSAKKESCGINMMISLNAGDKIKMRGKLIGGSFTETTPNTARLGVRKY